MALLRLYHGYNHGYTYCGYTYCGYTFHGYTNFGYPTYLLWLYLLWRLRRERPLRNSWLGLGSGSGLGLGPCVTPGQGQDPG